MKIDNLFLFAMLQELVYFQEGARIEKIHQPTMYDLIFQLRTKRGNTKLLISLHPETFRIQETKQSFKNPQNPKTFCIILRKYFEGAKIIGIEQLHDDRLIKIAVQVYDAVGNLVTRYLYVELMGKHSNCVLTDDENIIIDAFKKATIEQNQFREILPNKKYYLPPSSQLDKKFPFFLQKPYQAWLEKNNYEPEVLLLHARSPKGYVYQSKDQNKGFISFLDIQEVFPKPDFRVQMFDTLSEAMDFYFHRLTQQQQLKEKLTNLLQFSQQAYEKNLRKLKKLKRELEIAEHFEIYQEKGNILLTFQNQFKNAPRQEQVQLPNIFSEQGELITIQLHPQKTMTENAQQYFKKYTKGRNAISNIAMQIAKTKDEIFYFEGILSALTTANLDEAQEIEQELVEQNYLKQKKKGIAKQKNKMDQKQLLKFTINEKIFVVGKNNLQNDFITFKLRRKGYFWFHVKDFPGSHVLLLTSDINDTDIIMGAMLAAYFSKMRQGSNVAVDYTMVENVAKPSGAKPGFVIYTQQKTVFVTPDVEYLRKIIPNYLF